MNSNFYSKLLAIAAFFGVLGVCVGAFGAHFLKEKLDESSLEVLRTGVLYLFIHVIAILFVVVTGKNQPSSRLLKSAGILFGIGIFLFSGSLFLISTQSITGLTASYYGFVTPIGGLCFIAGWASLFVHAVSQKMA